MGQRYSFNQVLTGESASEGTIFEVLTFLSEWNLALVIIFFPKEEEGFLAKEEGGSLEDKIYLISTPFLFQALHSQFVYSQNYIVPLYSLFGDDWSPLHNFVTIMWTLTIMFLQLLKKA